MNNHDIDFFSDDDSGVFKSEYTTRRENPFKRGDKHPSVDGFMFDELRPMIIGSVYVWRKRLKSKEIKRRR